jgi:O-antigen biosynthesis protein
MRLLFVTPRYGELAGGAENLCRALIEHCCDGWDVEVATTCARDHFTWANELPAGTSEANGALVHRFPVSVVALARRPNGRATYLDEVESLARSVWSQELHDFLVAEGESFDLILCAPYLFGVTFWGAQVHPDRSVLIPCLHDEPEARLAPMRALFERVRGCVFNTAAEERLARSIYRVRRAGVVGIGVDRALEPADVDSFRREHRVNGPYLAYCGRLEEGKGVDVLVDYVARYNRGIRSDAKAVTLVLAGEGPYRPAASPHVKVVGFLPEHEKRAALAGALAYATASRMESLSITLLESWREGTPAIVPAETPVFAEHVGASGGGHVFRRPMDFARGVERFLDADERRRAGERGQEYVEERYNWGAVRARFRETIARLAA